MITRKGGKMASLYEIDQAILDTIDPETGEILDFDRLEELQMEREAKIEGVALWIKNLKADAAAYKTEKDAFAEREKQAKEKAEKLSEWIAMALNGEKLTTAKVAISFRKSESVEVNEEIVPKKWLAKKITFAPDKMRIKEAIKSGLKIKGCSIIEKQNIQIK